MSSGFRDRDSDRRAPTERPPTVVSAGGSRRAWGLLSLAFAGLAAATVMYLLFSATFGGSERPALTAAGGQILADPSNRSEPLDPWGIWDGLVSAMHRLGVGGAPPPEQASTAPHRVQTTTEYQPPTASETPVRPRTPTARDPWTLDPIDPNRQIDPATREGRERIDAARRKTIASLSPRFWVQLRPDLLKDVDPARLRAEGGALVIVRGYVETPDHFFLGVPRNLALREVSTGFVRVVYLRHGGPQGGQGWGVATLPPGNYVPVGAPTGSTNILQADGTMVQKVELPNGFVDVPPEDAVTVHAGDVLYLGSQIGTLNRIDDRPKGFAVLDEGEQARSWTRAELPRFAPLLKTALLPAIDHLK